MGFQLLCISPNGTNATAASAPAPFLGSKEIDIGWFPVGIVANCRGTVKWIRNSPTNRVLPGEIYRDGHIADYGRDAVDALRGWDRRSRFRYQHTRPRGAALSAGLRE